MEARKSSYLRLRFFGYPQIELDGAPVTIQRRKTLALLAYLAVTRQRVGREALAALFWPGYDAPQASAYLRHTLWELRQALGDAHLEIDRETSALIIDSGLWIDVVRFQELLVAQVGSTTRLPLLEGAVALYQGEFLAGLTLRDSPAFDEWQSLQSEMLRRRLCEALAALVEIHSTQGDSRQGIEVARRWLSVDPLQEGAYRALMRFYAHSGQATAALRQYEACVKTLKAELRISPEPVTTALYQDIRAGKIGLRCPEAPATVEPSPASEYRLSTIPIPATPFVGRETELAEIIHLLGNPACRLITLVGPGGIGKTRLAIEAARKQAALSQNSAAFVSVDTTSSVEGLLEAIAEVTQPLWHKSSPKTLPEQLRAQLLARLRHQELLLVLDNVEHLVGPTADLLVALLTTAQRIKVLVTSRERLNLREEWVIDIQGLACPPFESSIDLANYAAVWLFLQVAERNRVGLSLEPADWQAVARICRALEGVPLGIELAAPWVRTLSCSDIAAEIERNYDFLANSQRGAPERHHSLRSVFQHSWHLLTGREQSILRRLSAFPGGCSREAAAQVAGASLIDLSALVDKSLVRCDVSGRYNLHQVLKQYAAEKLAESPEEEQETRARQAAYYLDLLWEQGEALKGRNQRVALDLLEKEVANLRAAWQYALVARDWGHICRSVLALSLFGEMGLRKPEQGEAIRATLSAVRATIAREGPSIPLNSLLALLLAMRRFFAMYLEPDLPPQPLIDESLALAQGLPTCQEKAYTLLLNSIGRPLPSAKAQALLQECLAIFRGMGDSWGMATTQLVLADRACFDSHDLDTARPIYYAAQAAFQTMGNRWGEALCLFGLSHIAAQEGAYGQGIDLGRECLIIYQELGNPWRIIDTLAHIGQMAYAAGDLVTTRHCLEETLGPLTELGQSSGVAANLNALADIAIRQGHRTEARHYLERALAQFQKQGDRQGAYRITRRLAELLADITGDIGQ